MFDRMTQRLREIDEVFNEDCSNTQRSVRVRLSRSAKRWGVWHNN
jgi:hypothetical protein